MHKKIKLCYILPFFDEKTDTHLFYNYELIKESAKNLDIFMVIERAIGDPRKLGCKFKVQKFKNPVLRFLELFFILKITRLRGYTNFYTHYSYYGALTSWFVTLVFGGKAFYWNRGMPWLFKRGFFEEKIFQFILHHTILVTGPILLAEEYKKIYGVKEYRILSNWIDYERYFPQKSKEEYKKDLGLDVSKKYILFVHHLSERKGADFIAPVAEKFINENVEFLVAGDGPYIDKIRNQKFEIQNLTVLGKIPQSEAVRYFQASDVFFMPSREEGSPHVILEAMAAGTPFVASDIGGIREIVTSESKEFLCDVGDILCFTQKIKKLLDSHDVYKNVQNTNLGFVKNFSKEKAVRDFSKIFEPKIYYVANARFPTEKAHGIQMAKMIEAMIGAGANVEVIVPRRSQRIVFSKSFRSPEKLGLSRSESFQGENADNRPPQERTNYRFEKIQGVGSVAGFYGLRHEILVKKLPVLPFYNLGKFGFWIGSISFAIEYWIFLLWKRLRGEKFIVYTIDIDQFSFFAVPFVGVPYFVEVHDAKKKGFFFNLLFKNANGLIVINNLIKNTISKEFGVLPDKIIVHPNGIDLEKFSNLPSKSEARKKLNLPEEKKIALYIGKFYNWKGLGILSKTALSLHEVKFYLVGGSKEELIKVSEVKDCPENIFCAGQRDFKEIPLWLASADVLLVLGTKANEYSYKHTSPMKLFEYMASGKPIVASKTPAIEQIVSENEVVFYEPDNANNFADAILYALKNNEEIQKKSQNAYKKVKEYSWEKRAESIIRFIKSQTRKKKFDNTQ